MVPLLTRSVSALLLLCLSFTGGPGLLAGLAILWLAGFQEASAANVFLDQNGILSGSGFSTSGGSAVWDNASPFWVNAGSGTSIGGTLTSGTYTFSGADTVFFAGNGGTLSLGTLITLGSMTVSTLDPLTIAPGGGALQLGGVGRFSIGSGGVLNLGVSLNGGGFGLTKSGLGTLLLSGTHFNFAFFNAGVGSVAVAEGGSLTVQTGTSTTNVLSIGGSGGSGVLTIAPGARVHTGYLQIGTGGTSSVGAVINKGTLTVAGSAASSQAFQVGYLGGAYGYYRHDTPVSVSVPEIGVGGSGRGHGVMDVMSGTIGATSSIVFGRPGGPGYATGQMNIFGGSVAMPASTVFFYSAGLYGYASINVFSGGIGSGRSSSDVNLNSAGTVTSGTLATGMVNLQAGGVLSVRRVLASRTEGLTLLNMNGGTLRATASHASFVNNLTGFYLYSNGGTIDSNGFNITIPQAILGPSGYGLVPGTFEMSPAGGYVGRPIVLLTSNGSGSGAYAIADFNVTTGTVGGIIVTSPGYGYAAGDTITATFLGGGGSAGPVTLSGSALFLHAASNRGGLTKTGSGSLTLSGSNTYAGTTAVNAGLLQLANRSALNSGDIAGAAVRVLSGASLGLGYGGPSDFTSADLVTLLAGSRSIFETDSTLLLDTTNAPGDVPLAGVVSDPNSSSKQLSLRKIGAGMLTLNGSSAHSGGTTLAGGTLGIGHAGALGTGSLILTSGGIDNTSGAPLTLSTNNPQLWNGNFAFRGSNDLHLGSGTVTLVGSRTITIESSTLTVGGSLWGVSGGSLTKAGAGMLTLNGSSAHSGGTTLAGGTLGIGHAGALGTGSLILTSGGIDNTSGAPLTLSTNNPQLWNGNFAFRGSNDLHLGSGTVTITGTRTIAVQSSTLTVGGWLRGGSGVDFTKAGTGNLALLGAGTFVADTIVESGSVIFGGSFALGGDLNIGSGVVHLLPGASTSAGSIRVGATPGTEGALYVWGGSTTLSSSSDWVNVGLLGFGYFEMRGGSLNFNRLNVGANHVGDAGVGVAMFTGGTASTTALLIGRSNVSSEASGVMTMTGGSFAHSGNILGIGFGHNFANFTVSGTSIFNLQGGVFETSTTVSVGSSNISGSFYAGEAFLNLNGGVLKTNGVVFGTDGAQYVSFNGGTLQAGSSNTSLLAAGGSTGTVTILQNGATLDSNGFNVTVPANLAFPPGFGVAGGAITSAGTGYTGAPLISISGGGGAGASAYATVSNGTISSVVITSPGFNYTGLPTFTATGGGGSGFVFTSTLAGNSSGGLTKTGAGTLTLSGTNTYGGPTTVKEGILALARRGSLPLYNPDIAPWIASNLVIHHGAILSLNVGGADEFTPDDIARILVGSGSSGFLSGSTLAVDTTNAPSGTLYSGAIADVHDGVNSIGFHKRGSGSLTLTGTNTHSGGTAIYAGSLILSGGSNRLSPASPIRILGGALDLDGNLQGIGGTFTLISGAVQNGTLLGSGTAFMLESGSVLANLGGSVGLIKTTAGALFLGESNSYTGNTLIDAGSLYIGLGGVVGSLSPVGSIINNGAVVFRRSNTLTQGVDFGLLDSGTGRVVQLGGGSLVLTASNTYTGTTTLGAGTLMLGTGGTNGSISAASPIVNSGLLILNRSDTLVQGSNFSSLITGDGEILQLGGSLVLAGTILSSSGVLRVGAGVSRIVAGASLRTGMVHVGEFPGAVGALIVEDGSLTLNTLAGVANNRAPFNIGDGGFGYLEVRGGWMGSGTTRFTVAANSGTAWTSPVTGVAYITGGSMSFPELLIARTAASGGITHAVLTLDGGTLSISGTGLFSVGNDGGGTASINLESGVLDHSGGGISMGNGASFEGQSHLNLNGGVLKTGSIVFSNTVGPSFLNFNGGTLQAGAQGMILISTLSAGGGGIFAYAGGATLDTNGFDVTFAGTLSAPPGNGVAAAVLTGSGSGYIGAPLVQFSGSSGAGASGYATIRDGTIASIVITSAGTGYTHPTTLTLSGGGGPDTNLSTDIATNISGGLTKTGSGTLTLTGANTYAGETLILGGVLQIGSGGANGSIASSTNVRNFGTLIFNRSAATTQLNITGTGVLRQIGPGVTILGGSNSYTGATEVEAGTLQLSGTSALYGGDISQWTAPNLRVAPGATLALSLGGAGFAEDHVAGLLDAGGGLTNGSTLALDTTNSPEGVFVMSRNIADVNGIAISPAKIGPGTLLFNGTNTYSGTTTIRAGTLEVRGGAALPDASTVNVIGGRLLVSESETVGSLRGTSSGTILLANGAILTLGLPNSTGSLSSKITGVGSLNFIGGSLNLNGNNTFTGDVSVAAGTLVISDTTTLNRTGQTTPQTIRVDAGAVLSLNALTPMSITSGSSSTTTVLGGGTVRVLSPSVTHASLFQKLSLSPGAILDIQSGFLRNSSSPATDWTLNQGGLNLGPDATLRNWNGSDIFVDAITGSGRIGDASQTSFSSANITFGVANGSGVFSGTISFVTGKLIKTGTGTQVFSGTNSYSGPTEIRNGTLSVASINSVSTGSLSTSNLGSPLTSGSGSIILGSLTTTGGLLYTGAGETTDRIINLAGTTGGGILDHSGTGLLKFTALSGIGSFTATGAGSKTLVLRGSMSGTGEISAVIVNNSTTNRTAVLKQGSGMWILSGSNTYTGGTTVSEGSLVLSGGSNRLSTTGSLLVAGGVLDLSGYSQTTAGTITFAGGVTRNGTLIATGTAFNALAGTVDTSLSGSQGLVKTSAGTLILTAANSYTGPTTLAAGSLLLAGGNDRLPTTGTITLGGGTFDLGGNSQATSGSITLAGATVRNGILNSTGTAFIGQAGFVSATLSGTRGMIKSTSATLTLEGPNTYTGLTTVNAGVLAVSNAGSLDALSSLRVSANAQFVYAPGSSGTLTLATGTFNPGSSVEVNFGATLRFSGSVSTGGSISLIASGPYESGKAYALLQAANGLHNGTYTVTGANDYDYTLGITPTAVTLTPNYIGPLTEAYWVGGHSSAPSAWSAMNWSLTSGGALQSRNPGSATHIILDGNGTPLTSMTLGANMSVGSITAASGFQIGTLGYTAGLLLRIGSPGANGAVTARAGTLTILSDILLMADTSFTNDSPGTLTFGGVIAGTTAVVKSGSGTVVFYGANTYSGTTTISEGILQIGSGGSSGALSPMGPVINNGTLVVNRTGTVIQGVDLGPVLSGSGSLTKLSNGTLFLAGANTYTGDTSVLGGVVNVSHSSALGTGAGTITIADGAALEIQGDVAPGSRSFVLGGTGIAGSGVLRNVSGTNILSGVFTLDSAARIQSESGSLFLNGPVSLGVGSLTLGGLGGLTLSGVYSLGSGGLIKDGPGSLFVTGSGSHTGMTILSAGSIQVGTGGNTGALSASSAIINNGLLVFNRSNTVTQGVDFGMAISGIGGLQKWGAGSLVLTGTNTYGGPTTLAQGSLILAETGTLISSGSLIFGGFPGSTVAMLDLTNASATVANLLVQTNTASANRVTIGSGQILRVSGGSFLTVGANIAANTTAQMTFSGAGTLQVSLPAGVLTVGRVTGSSNNAGTLDVSGLALFTVDAADINVGNARSEGYIHLSNTQNFIRADRLSLGDAVGGPQLSRAPVLTLGQGVNTIEVDTLLVGVNRGAGVLKFQHQTAGTLGTATISGKTQALVNIFAGTLIGNTTSPSSGTIDFRGHNVSVRAGTVILGVGSYTSGAGGNSGSLRFDSGTFSVKTLVIGSNSAVTGSFTGTNSGSLHIGGGTFTVASGGRFLIAGTQSNNTGISRALVDITGGSLLSNVDIEVGSGTNALATIALRGGTLDLNGRNIGSASTAGNPALDVQSGRLQNIGSIAGSGGITKTTAGALTLAGVNTFAGGVTVAAGTLHINSPNALGSGSLTLAAATSLDNTSGEALTLASPAAQLWSGDVTFVGSNPLHIGTATVTLGGSANLSVNGSTFTLAGILRGDGFTFTKSGPGTLVLAGSASDAVIQIAGGSLVAGAPAPFGDSQIQVSGGNLDLRSHAVSASSLTMSGGALHLALGNSLTLSGEALLVGTVHVSGEATSLGNARYSLATASGGWGGSPSDGALPDNARYHIQINGASLDLQHRATLSLAPTAVSQSVHAGSVAIGVSVGNTAPVFSDTLIYNLSGALSGSSLQLAAGATTTVSGSYFVLPGINSLSVFAIPSGSIATTNGTQSTTFSVTGYSLASVSSSQTVDLGAFRTGTQPWLPVALSNLAPASDLYSESLSATGFSGTTANLIASGSVDLIPGGSSDFGTLRLQAAAGIPAGVFTAATTLGLVSRAVSGSGLNDTTLTPQTITVSGAAYDYANPVYAGGSLAFGNVRVGAGSILQSAAFANAPISNAAYQDALDVSATTNNAKVSASALNGLLAGAGSAFLSVSGTTATAGDLASTLSLVLTSNPRGVPGLSGSLLAVTASLQTSGGVYDYANPVFSGGTLHFGNVRVGGVLAPQSVIFKNAPITDAAYQDSLHVSATADNPRVSATGFSALAAGTGNAALVVTAETATAGSLNSTLALALLSHPNGVPGLSDRFLVPGSLLSTSGGVYALANPTFSSDSLSFGNVRVGGTHALQAGNSSGLPDFQDSLDLSFVLPAGITGFAGTRTLSAGSSVSVVFTAAARGILSGSAELNQWSNSNGVAGLSNTPLPAQMFPVSGTAYSAAAGSVSVASLGNFHVGVPKFITLFNTSPADSFSEDLSATLSAVSNTLVDGSVAHLIAGGSDASSLSVTLLSAGTGAFRLELSSAASVGGIPVAGLTPMLLPSQILSVTQHAVAHNLAAVSPTQAVNVGNVRRGTQVTVPLLLTNTAPPSAGFTETLSSSGFIQTTSGFVSGGSVAGIAGGSSGTGSLFVGLSSFLQAGAHSGTALLGVASIALPDSGLANTALPPQTITVSGAVYDYANPVYAGGTLNFGNVRVGASTPLRSVPFTNAVLSNAAYQDGLDVAAASDNFRISATGFTGLAAGAGTRDLSIGVYTGSAGSLASTLSLSITSNARGIAGLTASNITPPDVLRTTGGVFAHAQPAWDANSVAFGNVHVGVERHIRVSNAVMAPAGYQDVLDLSGTGTQMIGITGGTRSLAPGESGTIGLSVLKPGSLSGTVMFSQNSNANGVVGLENAALAVQGVTITGNAYALAVGSVASGSTAHFHVGVARALVLTNTAPRGLYSEDLSATLMALSNVSVSGSVDALAAGDSDSTRLRVTLLQSGTGAVRLNLESTGRVRGVENGLGTTPLAPQTLHIQATGYLRAATDFEDVALDLGAVRENEAFIPKAVSITNTLPADRFSESLQAVFVAAAGASTTVDSVVIPAGSMAAQAVGVGLGAGASRAGSFSSTVSVQFTSLEVDQSGLGNTALPEATRNIRVSGKVYRLASGSVNTEVHLGAIREGDLFANQAVTVRNSADADGFSDDLRAAFRATSAPSVRASGEVERLEAGFSAESLQVGLDASGQAAGLLSGTAVLGYTSLGRPDAGLADATPVKAADTIRVSGKIYRLASGTLGARELNLGTLRAGGAGSGAILRVTNTAEADGFSDLLEALALSDGGFQVSGSTLLLAGSRAESVAVTYQPEPHAAGVVQGTVWVTMRSVGQSDAAYAPVSLGTQRAALHATVFRPASAGVSHNGTLLVDGGSLALAPVRLGADFQPLGLDVRNKADALDGYSESLNASSGSVTGLASITGGARLVAPGQTRGAALQVGMNPGASTTTGLKSGSVALLLETDGTGSSGLPSAALGAMTLQVSGQVYDGKGVWLGGAGAWADWAKWTVSGGRPGMDHAASIASGDSAFFDSGLGGVEVTLPGSTLNLSGMTLSGTGGVRLMGGGLVALAGTIRAAHGAHELDATVALVPHAAFVVEEGARLSIRGVLSGGPLLKEGAGTLALATGYQSMETAEIRGGRLELGNGVDVPVIGEGDLAVEDGRVRTIYLGLGAELAFNVGRSLDFPNLQIIGPGAANVVSVNPQFEVTWKNRFPEVVFNSGELVDLGTWRTRGNVRVERAFFILAHSVKTVPNALEVTGSLGISTGSDAFLSLSGVISGSGSLVKEGDGVLSLSAPNAWSGGVTVNAGTLAATRADALGFGPVALAGSSRLVVDLRGTGTLSNTIRGAGSVVKSGSGELVLSSPTSDYTGGTTVSDGILRIGSGRALGSGSLHVMAPATLIAGTGGASSLVLENNIYGGGSFLIDSDTSVLLTGSNTLSGGMTLRHGTLRVGSATALGTGELELGGGVLMLEAPLRVRVPLRVSGVSGLVSGKGFSGLDGGIAGEGTVNLSGTLSGTAQVVSGRVTVSGGTLLELVKSGSGRLVLSGSTRLAGSAVVASGSLVLENARQTLSGVNSLVVGDRDSSAAVLDVGSSGATLSGGQTLKGSGTVSGVLRLARASRLAPGNSVGTQRIRGRLEFEQGSLYEAEVRILAGILESDLYQVTGPGVDGTGTVIPGSIRISGGTVVAIQEINLSNGTQRGTGLSTGRITGFSPQRFLILSSTVGAVIAGTFESVVSGALWKSRLEYSGEGGLLTANPGRATLSEKVHLVLQRVPYRTLGGGGTRAQVGHALDLALATQDPLLKNLLDILDRSQTAEQVIAILDQLNPRIFTEVYSLALNRLQDVQKVVSDRMTLLGAAKVAREGDAWQGSSAFTGSEWTVWTGAYGSWSNLAANPNRGEGAVSRTSQGNATGVERQIGALTLGVLGVLGTEQSQMGQPRATLASESWHFGLYLNAPVRERLFVDGLLFVGEAENTLTRTQNLPVTDEFGTPTLLSIPSRTRLINREWLAQFGMGMQLAREGAWWSVIPSIRVAHAGVYQNRARESGGRSLGLVADSKNDGTVLTRMGIDFAAEGRIGHLPVRMTSSAAWVHDFATNPRRLDVRWQGADSPPWTISGARQSADLLRVGLALECGLGDRRSLRLYGEQEFLDRRRIFRGGAAFTVSF